MRKNPVIRSTVLLSLRAKSPSFISLSTFGVSVEGAFFGLGIFTKRSATTPIIAPMTSRYTICSILSIVNKIPQSIVPISPEKELIVDEIPQMVVSLSSGTMRGIEACIAGW